MKVKLLTRQETAGPKLFPTVHLAHEKSEREKKKNRKRKRSEKERTLFTCSTDPEKRREANKKKKLKKKKIMQSKYFCRYCETEIARGRKNRNVDRHQKSCPPYVKAAKRRAAYRRRKQK